MSGMSADEYSKMAEQEVCLENNCSSYSVDDESGYDDTISEITDSFNDSIEHESDKCSKNEDDFFNHDKHDDGRDSALADDMSTLSMDLSGR